MNLTIDFETRSAAKIKDTGGNRYAEDDTTQVICLAVLLDDKVKPYIWFPEWVYCTFDVEKQDGLLTDMGLSKLIGEARTIHAHNASFETDIWNNIMVADGFEPIDPEKWVCTAAQAAAHALPRDLARACKVMNLSEEKDDTGHKVMLKMCKPRKPRKREREANPDWESELYWHEDQEEFETLVAYCRQDTIAERELGRVVPALKAPERKLWLVDQKINRRGVYVDLPVIEAISAKLKKYETSLLSEVSRLTYREITSCRQVQATLKWAQSRGLELPDLQKNTVAIALKQENLDERVRRLLEIRQALGKSSISKYAKMQSMACKDSRIKGTMMYHGASTGRWAGRGVQPQNMPRGELDDWVDEAIEEFTAKGKSLLGIQTLFGCPMEAGSSCLRAMLRSAPGNKLYCSDFANIEGRVLAWLSGETWKIEAYEAYDAGTGPDLYKVAASDIYGVPIADVTKAQRQVGKTSELACGYQGGVRAFQSMAVTYGVTIPDTEADRIKEAWRDTNPNIKAWWYQLEQAAMECVYTGKIVDLGNVKFGMSGRFLYVKLPSGRYLSYCDPAIRPVKTPWGQQKDALTFMGVNSVTTQWTRGNLYGGLWAENITQAVARDFLAEAILRCEEEDYPVVMHVHDEVVSETAENVGSLKRFNEIMAECPEWGAGCPIAVEGWEGVRYRK